VFSTDDVTLPGGMIALIGMFRGFNAGLLLEAGGEALTSVEVFKAYVFISDSTTTG